MGFANLQHTARRMWTCVEPKFRHCLVNLCSSNNHYTAAPQQLIPLRYIQEKHFLGIVFVLQRVAGLFLKRYSKNWTRSSTVFSTLSNRQQHSLVEWSQYRESLDCRQLQLLKSEMQYSTNTNSDLIFICSIFSKKSSLNILFYVYCT